MLNYYTLSLTMAQFQFFFQQCFTEYCQIGVILQVQNNQQSCGKRLFFLKSIKMVHIHLLIHTHCIMNENCNLSILTHCLVLDTNIPLIFIKEDLFFSPYRNGPTTIFLLLQYFQNNLDFLFFFSKVRSIVRFLLNHRPLKKKHTHTHILVCKD